MLMMIVLSCSSCIEVVGKTKRVIPNKQYQSKMIQVQDFDAVSVIGNCDVIFTPAAGEKSLELYASENVIDLIEVYVEGSKLVVRIKKDYNINRNNDVMELRVSAPMIRQAKVTGSATFLVTQDCEVDDLTLGVTGSGDILAKGIVADKVECSVTGSGDVKVAGLSAKELTAKITGSGDVEMAGSVDEASYLVTGSGDIDAEAVQAKAVKAKVTGSGDIRCYPIESLDANRTGSGTILYKGDGVNVTAKGVRKI